MPLTTHLRCKPLLEVLPLIHEPIRNANKIALFLDFDGTLTPIAPGPRDVHLDPSVRDVLEHLSNRDDILVTIISGRALRDIRALIGVRGIVYAGNHGLEISGRHVQFVEPVAAARRTLIKKISETITERLQSVPGALVEFKDLTISVHYRQVAPESVNVIAQTVQEMVESAGPLLQLNTGKMVLEIVPRTGWHKGAATAWIFDRLTAGTGQLIYIGDDRTDEDAFRRFRDAITVRVGDPEETAANYFLDGPAEVHEFLLWLSLSRRV